MVDTKYFQFLELISQNTRGNIITLKCGIYVYLSSEIKIAIFSIGHTMLVMKDIINTCREHFNSITTVGLLSRQRYITAFTSSCICQLDTHSTEMTHVNFSHRTHTILQNSVWFQFLQCFIRCIVFCFRFAPTNIPTDIPYIWCK